MKQLTAVVFRHLHNYAKANCPKLVRTPQQGGAFGLMTKDWVNRVRLVIDGDLFTISYSIGSPTVRERRVEVSAADPTSLEQLEQFIQEFHDKLSWTH